MNWELGINGVRGINWTDRIVESVGKYKLLAEHVSTSLETSFDLDLIGKELVYGKEYLLSFSWLSESDTYMQLYINDNNISTNYAYDEIKLYGSLNVGSRLDRAMVCRGTSGYWQYGDIAIQVLSNGQVTFSSKDINDSSSGIILSNFVTVPLFTVSNIEKLTPFSTNGIGIGSTFRLYEIGGA